MPPPSSPNLDGATGMKLSIFPVFQAMYYIATARGIGVLGLNVVQRLGIPQDTLV